MNGKLDYFCFTEGERKEKIAVGVEQLELSMLKRRLNKATQKAGFTRYDYDWKQRKNYTVCWIDLAYRDRIYRFAMNTQVSGLASNDINGLFALLVQAIEGMAQIVDSRVIPLSMLLYRIPSKPDTSNLPDCVLAMGFDHMPASEKELKTKYRELAKKTHPDTKDGNESAFQELTVNYEQCQKELKKRLGGT